MRDRPPHWEKVGRNVYSAKLRPKRRQRDEIGAVRRASITLVWGTILVSCCDQTPLQASLLHLVLVCWGLVCKQSIITLIWRQKQKGWSSSCRRHKPVAHAQTSATARFRLKSGQRRPCRLSRRSSRSLLTALRRSLTRCKAVERMVRGDAFETGVDLSFLTDINGNRLESSSCV